MLKIKKIYHISDIHLRNFKRHAEYKRVFQKVSDYIKNTKTDESIICITGDVVHSKTDITPELVQEVQEFLRMMSALLPVVVIPGNHDANLNNNDRLDSLSPIINAMADKNITYLKDSGVFKIANIDFVHWSVFDDVKNYIKASDIKSECKICLYHGPVNDSYTDLGFKLTGNSVSPSDFGGFDLALLGDIHVACQYVNDKKTAAYPGSLIQQDHGESLDHGILVWDVESKTSEFVRIQNDTAFYTIDVENGIYKDLPKDLPVNIYLKIRSKNTSPAEIKSIVAEIKDQKNVIELTQQVVKDQTSASLVNVNNSNVRDVSYQNFLLTDHLKSKFGLSQEDIEKVCELNTEINKSLPKTDSIRNIHWNPKRFEFSNMFSYGKDNVIDFTDMNGSYGVFARNASGKSSAIEALVYCLFDKSSKTNKAAMVMNNRSNDFYCKFEFELDGNIYTIERRASYRSNSDSVKQDVSFYYADDQGNIILLNGKDRADTNASIRSVIGTYDDFVLTSMSMQNNNIGFIDMGQSERKDLLSQFLDIKVFEDLNSIASENIKEYSVLIKEYKKYDYFSKLKDLDSSLKSYSVEYRELEEKKKILEEQIDIATEDYVKMSSKLAVIDSDILDIERLESQKKAMTDVRSALNDKKKDLEKKLKDNELELKKAEDEAQKSDELSYNDAKLDLKNSTDKIAQLSILSENLKYDISQKLEKMKKLEDLKYDESCKYCMENAFVKDAIATKGSIESDKENSKKVVLELEELKGRVQILNTKVASYESAQVNLTKKKNEKMKTESDLNKIDLDLHKNETSIKDVESKIKLHDEKEAAIESNKDIRSRLNVLQAEISSLKSDLSKVSGYVMSCNTNINVCEEEIAKTNLNINNLKALEDKFKYYEYYLSATGRDGLPYDLISSVIPKIQDEINNILAQIVDFCISIQSDGKNINAYIVYDETKKWPIELSSGMEKFISSLAIRSSLINLASLPRPNFLVIDEGWGTLDQGNLRNVSILMEYLKTQFKFVVIISHIESIKDIVDHQISIDKVKDGFSKVYHE